MKFPFAALCLAASLGLLYGQAPTKKNAEPPVDPAVAAAKAEESELEQSLGEAGSSPLEYARALENHLKKYPKSARRDEILRVLVRASVDLKDKRRLIEYGVPVIEAGTQDSRTLEHVTRALLDRTDVESLERASRYAKHLQDLVEAEAKLLQGDKEYKPGRGARLDELETLRARALAFRARAAGLKGDAAEALKLAEQSFQALPSAEGAREVARWYERSGNPAAALPYLATALVIDDPRATADSRALDRVRLTELAAKAGRSADLGNVVLAAYDESARLMAERRARYKELDPNFQATQVTDYTLSALDGKPLALASLKGKIAVLDFWATWCGPCRAQYPLYEQVKERFKERKDVVFLAVSTDEDRELVAPFLTKQKWNKQVYFEDGLGTLLRINSIPTTIVLGKDGGVVSRMNGYVPDRFVDMLSARIESALADGQ